MKQGLSEVFAVYLTFATELEEQSKQLLEKVEQASCSLNGHRGDEIQSKYLECVAPGVNRDVAFRLHSSELG